MTRRRYSRIAAAALLSFSAICAPRPLAAGARDACDEKRNDDMVGNIAPQMARRAARALKVGPEVILEHPERFVYRCMNGAIWVCDHGANISCAKADTRRRMRSVDDYCKSNPDSIVPMFVTGHGASHLWKCESGKPVITDSLHVDERGFIADHWRSLDQ